jgi:hypothetical protein
LSEDSSLHEILGRKICSWRIKCNGTICSAARSIMNFKIDRLYHPSHRVPDLDAATKFFEVVFGRSSIPIADHQRSRGVPLTDSTFPTDYSIFTPISDVYFDCISPAKLIVQGVQLYPSISSAHLNGFGWGVDGIDDLWSRTLQNGIHSTDSGNVPYRGVEPPGASFSTMKLFYTEPESTGLRYEFLPTEGIAPADKRGDPDWVLPPVSDSDPLGIIRCSHHTVLTNNLDRALNLLVTTIDGVVVHEGYNETLETKSTFVELAGDLFEFAEPLGEGTPAMEDWKQRAPLDTYHSLTWRVVDLDRVADHLLRCNIRMRVRTDEVIVSEPEDSLGIPWGFTTRSVPY